jgi:hypothetical protein
MVCISTLTLHVSISDTAKAKIGHPDHKEMQETPINANFNIERLELYITNAQIMSYMK